MASVRAERAKGKSRMDDTIVAQGKRSAALGEEPKVNVSLSPSLVFSQASSLEKNKTREKGGWEEVASTQGGGPPALRSGGPCPGLLSRCPSGAPELAAVLFVATRPQLSGRAENSRSSGRSRKLS